MRLKLLGPLELLDDAGRPVVISAPKRRAVLAALALDANRMVLASELLDFVWGDNCPPSARTALQVHISAIRKHLDSTMRLVTHERGYRLLTPTAAVDTVQFDGLVEQARATESHETAIETLRAALALWHGPSPLADVPGGPLRDLAAGRLAEARLAALESLADRLMAVGRGGEVLSELTDGVWSNPLRESMVERLIGCLAQLGRRADAVDVYHDTRRRLRDVLGVEPGRRLQSTYHALLTDRTERPSAEDTEDAKEFEDAVTPSPRVESVGVPAAPPVPAQLPRTVSSFVAREAELQWLADRICSAEPGGSGVLLVVGSAGVGKTALAVRAATQVSPEFPDGQLFVNMRGFDEADPLDPGAALMGFLRALDVPDTRVPESVAERAKLYRSLTAHKRMLIVLDNARSAGQVRPLLPGGAGSVVVVTSRIRLDGLVVHEGATPLTLRPLSEEDSVLMLAGVVGDVTVKSEESAARRLAELCAGLPLALRIAASQLSMSHDGDPVAAVVGELSDERLRLAALSTYDEDVSLQATLSLSYRGLPADAASLFRLIGLHPGNTLDVHVVVALTGWTRRRTDQALQALTAAHLLEEVHADRYEMHDLLRLHSRELAAQQVDAGERASAVLRVLEYYLHVSGVVRAAVTSGVTPSYYSEVPPVSMPRLSVEDEGLSWFITEEPAMHALMSAGVRRGQHRQVWQLADNLSPLYCRAGSTVRWAAAMQAGLDAARADDDALGQSLLLWRRGAALRAMGRPEEALPVLREAHVLTMRTSEDGVRQFNVLRELGYCELQLNRFDDVCDHYGQALEITQRLGLANKAAFVLDILAWTYARAGDLEQSRRHAELAIETLREARHADAGESVQNSARGLVLVIESHALQRLGRYSDALAGFYTAHELVVRAKDWRGAAVCLAAIGTVLVLMGRDDEARTPLTQALTLYTELACTDVDDVRAQLDALTDRQELRVERDAAG